MPQVSPPVPSVPKFVHGVHKLREARGFSLGELKQAGVLKSQARLMGIRVDSRRSTVHSQNVTALRAFLTPSAEVTVAPEATVETTTAPEAEKVSECPKRRAKRRAEPAKKPKR